MDDRGLNGWPADVARAFLAWLFYAAGVLFTFVLAWGGLSWLGLGLLIVTMIFGPFAAAWLACRIVPADRPLIAILGWGIILGLVFFLFVGFSILKIAERRYPGLNHAYIFVVCVAGGPLLGALAFSLLRRLGLD